MDRLLNAMTILSILLMALVLFSVRRSHIRVEYSVSWLSASIALLVLSRSRVALNWITNYLGLPDAPLALLMLVFCVFLVVFYRFSVIISELKDSNVALTQRLAILEYRLHSQHEEQR